MLDREPTRVQALRNNNIFPRLENKYRTNPRASIAYAINL